MQERLHLGNQMAGMLRHGETARKFLVATASLSAAAFGVSFADYMYQFARMPPSVFGSISLATSGVAITSWIASEHLKSRNERAKTILRRLWN